MTRREWLCGLALGAPGGYAPTLAVQAYVWQQALAREKRTLAEGAGDVAASLAEAGYRRVELTSSFFTPELAPRMLELLEKHGLKLDVVYNGGDMHEGGAAARTIEDTLALVERVKPARIAAVSFNANPKKGERKTDAELETQTRAIGELGRRLRGMGLRLLVHEHAPELSENAREWRHMLRGTEARDVGICLDIDWVRRGGLEPMALLEEAGDRVGDLHLRNSRGGVWLEELADGDVDYSKVAAHLRRKGYRGWLVVELAWERETRITRGLTENLRRSRVWAERVFGVRA
ncbi:MAG: Inosose dehydratase [Bryobacteraceae bacterium]|nr:Inosose dehydratase [Bryobacteraceae bacterium]